MTVKRNRLFRDQRSNRWRLGWANFNAIYPGGRAWLISESAITAGPMMRNEPQEKHNYG